MAIVEYQVDISSAIASLNDIEKQQIPFAASRAVNNVAKKVVDTEKNEIRRVFDRPTPYTQNSVAVFKYSNKRENPIEAQVGIKQDAAKGTAAAKYLAPEVFGGPRRAKRIEKALQNKGLLPVGHFVVPAKGLPLDQYGNITAGMATKILSGLRASFDPRQNRPRIKKGSAINATEYFVGKPAGGRYPNGVWVRTGRSIKMLLMFVRQPTYDKRFDFYEIATKTIQKEWPVEFDAALSQALATAR